MRSLSKAERAIIAVISIAVGLYNTSLMASLVPDEFGRLVLIVFECYCFCVIPIVMWRCRNL